MESLEPPHRCLPAIAVLHEAAGGGSQREAEGFV
jgi:hypothetical protein